ncbi:MAG: phosphate ABC transporter permease, partial [Pseudomonas sp.]
MTDITSKLNRDSGARTLLPGSDARAALRKRRTLKDKISRWGITTAGFGVVFALAMIFVYLFYEVFPILKGATVTPQATYSLPVAEGQTQSILIERYEELGLQYTDNGVLTFFQLDNGSIRRQIELPVPEDATITAFGSSEPIGGVVAHGLDNGQVLVVKHDYDLSFPAGSRVITPKVTFPFGEEPIVLDAEGSALRHVAIETVTRGSGGTLIAALTDDNRLLLTSLTSRTNMMTGAVEVQTRNVQLPRLPAEPVKMLLDKALRSLFVADVNGLVHYYDVSTPANARLVQSVDAGQGSPITAIEFLVGTVSLVVGNERGELTQWFLVRDENNNYDLTYIRDFKSHNAPITAIAPEYNRKGFLVGDAEGKLGVHYGTSAQTLYLKKYTDKPISRVAISPVNGRLMALDEDNQLHIAGMWNQHPQLSFGALWNKVWYEGRSDPEYIWQSSSGSDEFESKFSLVPLSIGTLKAAFYAMLFAMPLAIAGAVYTAYFMSPKLR